MAKLVITNRTYPPTMKVFDNNSLKMSVDIKDYEETVKQTLQSLDMNIFERLYIEKAMHLLEAETIEIEDNNEK